MKDALDLIPQKCKGSYETSCRNNVPENWITHKK